MGRLKPRGDGKPVDYHFESEWFIPADAVSTATVLHDPLSCLVWWRAGFLRGELIEPGNEDRIGAVVRFLTKGCFPYSFQFVLRVMEAKFPDGFIAAVAGHFEGEMRCRIEPLAVNASRVRCEWIVRVHQPFVRHWSPLIRRMLAWNHQWIMRQGEIGLSLAAAAASLESVTTYPIPTFPHCWRSFRDGIPWEPWTASWELAKAHSQA